MLVRVCVPRADRDATTLSSFLCLPCVLFAHKNEGEGRASVAPMKETARALTGVAVYVAIQEVLRQFSHRRFTDTDCGGTPCWVAALKLIPQLIVLPAGVCAALRQHGWSTQRWSSHNEKYGITGPALLVAYAFVAFLVVDLYYAVLFPGIMRLLMVQHHVVCLLGHAYALLCCPRASQPYFLFAITWLEIGSSSANVFWLLLGTPYAAHGSLIYAFFMTISHLAAITLTFLWNWSAGKGGLHVLLRWPPMVVWGVLMYMRQIEIAKVVMPRMDPAGAIYQPGATCGAQRFFETASESTVEIVSLLAWYAVAWAALWLACGWLAERTLCPLLPDAVSVTRPFENTPMYVGQKMVAIFKCALVAAIANFALYSLWFSDSTSRTVEFGGYPLVEVAGVLFTSFEIADLALCLFFGFLDPEHVLHHVIHIVLGVLIRGNCAPALTASILMAQETSGLPLNYYLLVRHRTPDHISVLGAQIAFASCFFVWRLLIGTYGTYHYLKHASDYLPGDFPSLSAKALGVSLVLASALQWFWGVGIIKMVLRKMKRMELRRERLFREAMESEARNGDANKQKAT